VLARADGEILFSALHDPSSAVIVAKVKNRTTQKISLKLISGPPCHRVAL